jgi:hypothetical protein
MSLGGNLSSGRTDNLNDAIIRCAAPPVSTSSNCCNKTASGPKPVAVYPSMLLESQTCPPPTPAEFALYPKVAIPCSARTESLMNRNCATLPIPSSRFSQFTRYRIPVPCQPLPPSANMAGISKPSTRLCNL